MDLDGAERERRRRMEAEQEDIDDGARTEEAMRADDAGNESCSRRRLPVKEGDGGAVVIQRLEVESWSFADLGLEASWLEQSRGGGRRRRWRTEEMIGEGGVDRRTRRRRRLEGEEKSYRSADRYTGRYESLAKIGWFGTGQDNRCNPEWMVGTRFHRNLRRPYLLRSSLKSGNSKLYVILASCSSFLSQDLVHSLSSQSRRVSQRC